MFACFYSLSAAQNVLVKVAEDYSPRFEIVGPLVILDLAGLRRLFGTPREIGEQMRRSFSGAPVRIAIGTSQTAVALLALGRPGLTVVSGDEQRTAIGALPVSLLGELAKLRGSDAPPKPVRACLAEARVNPPERRRATAPHAGDMVDVLPYFQSCLDRTSGAAAAQFTRKDLNTAPPATLPAQHSTQTRATGEANASPPANLPALHSNCGAGGWQHPRDSHAAKLTKRLRRQAVAAKALEHSAPPALLAALHPPKMHPTGEPSGSPPVFLPALPPTQTGPKRSAVRENEKANQVLLDVLRRWGVKTLGALAALPAGDVYERLGPRGVAWQRLARGEDEGPLVPCVPEEPFEGVLELEWPIEGLEPLSFVLARLFEPLSDRLERADRGAAILHTHLRLTTREVYARTVQLPSPMRDPKTLRTLVLLDLESNPPSAAIDTVRVLVEPTPAKVLQWTLYERAQPSPEQVSTLLARLTALMGEGHVGSPVLVDSWKPGLFEMIAFSADKPQAPLAPAPQALQARLAPAPQALLAPQAPLARLAPPPQAPLALQAPLAPSVALRRFRLPIPARVQMHDGHPVRVMVDRRGVTGGSVAQSAGPWRTSGEWWNEGWDRDEWDVHLDGGAVYRIFVERTVGQWFIEGVLD